MKNKNTEQMEEIKIIELDDIFDILKGIKLSDIGGSSVCNCQCSQAGGYNVDGNG